MPRLLGLGYASRLYRDIPGLAEANPGFSRAGAEVAWGTIGNASCAEGMFWEAVNAAGVLGGTMLLSIWDDGYGISVANEQQIAKGDLSAVLAGFQRRRGERRGLDLHSVRGWDYPALVATYQAAAATVRRDHVPAIVHVTEMTQPQGHSTSGSHERYKSKERLAWEEEFDPIRRLRQWAIEQGVATATELAAIEEDETRAVRAAQQRAWVAFRGPIEEERRALVALLGELARGSTQGAPQVERLQATLVRQPAPLRRDLQAAAREALLLVHDRPSPQRDRLVDWQREEDRRNRARYATHLHSESRHSALRVAARPPVYAAEAPTLNGFEILNAGFDAALARLPQLLALGEDVGRLGDVNQGFAGLQAKYGELRVADTGIRETTILGQAIGMAMRGLRPIAEIQYLDYLLYCLQLLADDLATLRWRTAGAQMAPVIVRTRGHRLEGVWHAGSPMAGILNLVRGVWVCVPRNMTQAVGFYNTLLASDDPGLVVEVLNGYRVKEKLPRNIGELAVPLGVPEVLRTGGDLTLVTYGACCRLALDAAEQLARLGVETEVVDVQTLLPFDRPQTILASLKKTNRILFLDEDVPGGASAYMLQQVVEGQDGYAWLDAPPRTLTATEHRPAYGSDGDYWSKPNRETIFAAAWELLHESDPRRYPLFYR
jgi:pyruvate/2-oxoglutarate/acetoin dehydrogenase E1 component